MRPNLQNRMAAVRCGLDGHDAPLVEVHDVVVVADHDGDTCHSLKRKAKRGKKNLRQSAKSKKAKFQGSFGCKMSAMVCLQSMFRVPTRASD